jgi:alanine dehydrogenase
VSRGAIYALQGRGFNNIHVVTMRQTHLVADRNPDVYYEQYTVSPDGRVHHKTEAGEVRPILEVLVNSDVICNGVLQDTDSPTMFVRTDEVECLRPRSAIVDISCDEGMGFPFARPTSFEAPTFIVGNQVTYYSVDHTPSYLWNAASREISRALIPYLPLIAAGPTAWKDNATIDNAVEIEDGIVRNPRILRFQRRSPDFPHHYIP